jgi:2-amino-4-hydroxy-6-hydroxymethyldihydropteridine diphosphokinase
MLHHYVYLLLGSNIGEREKHFEFAISRLNAEAGNVVKISSFYETAPWGVTGQQNYLNAALLLETELSPESLFHTLKNIEKEAGRTDLRKYAPRPLDIDILFYDDEVIKTNDLTIPHEKLHLRRFTLVPLNELAPEFHHPVLNKTIAALLQACEDPLEVKLVAESKIH